MLIPSPCTNMTYTLNPRPPQIHPRMMLIAIPVPTYVPRFVFKELSRGNPEDPRTQMVGFERPNTMNCIVFGLKPYYLGPWTSRVSLKS